jgi:parallel beta-helix repeat protein
VQRGGTADRPLHIAAAPGARIVGTEPLSQESIYLEDVSWLILEGFTVERAGMPGFGIGAHDALPERPMRGLVVRNNVVRDSGSTNIYLSQVADSVIEGNIASGSHSSHGIYLANAGSDNTVLRGNNCYDNAKNGIHFNGDLAATGDGLQRDLVIEGNVLHDNRANGLNLDGVQASTVRNNLVFGNGRHALRAYAIDGAAGPRDLIVVNNTFVDNGGWALKLSEDGGGHTVFNNILLSAAGSIVVGSEAFASDHNLVAGAFSVDTERTLLSIADWQRRGFDNASLVLSDREVFVARAARNFRPAAGSPALGRGVTSFRQVAAPLTDLAGRARAAAAPALGALEAAVEPCRPC